MRWKAVILVAGVVAGWAIFGRQLVYINVSPLASVFVNGEARVLNPDAALAQRSADVVADGFVDDQYLFEVPLRDGRCEIELRFPKAIEFSRVTVIGGPSAAEGKLTLVGRGGDEGDLRIEGLSWSAAPGYPPIQIISRNASASTIELHFESPIPVVLNSIQCYTVVPRWQAWTWFVGVQILGPWLYGAVWAAAVFGWGRLIRRRFQSADLNESTEEYWSQIARTFVAGLAVVGVFSATWIFLPDGIRFQPLGWLLHLVLFSPAMIVVSRGAWRGDGLRFLGVMAAAALLFVTTVAVDSTLVVNRRVKPMDHVFGLITAQHLLSNVSVPHEMVLRPWLVPALAAPTVASGERFAYWLYLGQMAWMNACGLIGVALVARHLGLKPVGSAAFAALLPIAVNYHFPGQRVLVAGLSLIAIQEWIGRRESRWWWWGGFAAGMAVLAHPGALFILPAAAVYFVAAGRPKPALGAGLGSVAIALCIYAAWVGFTRHQYPNAKNYLVYYPLMRTLDDHEPLQFGFFEAARSLSADHWKELGWNRVSQLRHYFWSNNPWQTGVSETLRPISLTTSFGIVMTAVLVWGLRRHVRSAFFWTAIAGPLLLFHVHMGQAFPQFHILPTPFFALAVLGIAAVRSGSNLIALAVVAESLVHQTFAPALVFMGVVGDFELPGWFVADRAAVWLVALPVLPWAYLAKNALTK